MRLKAQQTQVMETRYQTIGHGKPNTHLLTGPPIFLIFFSFLILSGNLWSTTYYVDSQLGDDSFDGHSPSPGQGNVGPWKTIEKVNNISFSPGDQVLFKRGSVWNDETLIPQNGGAAGGTITINESINGQLRSFQLIDPADNNCIYFGAYGSGTKPRLQCDGRRGIEIRHDYLIFEDFHLADGNNNVLWFNNPNGNRWSLVSNIDVTGCVGNAVRSSEGGGNLWLKGLYVYDYAINGIYLEGSPANPLKGVLVEDCHVEDPVVFDKEDAIACHDDSDGNRIDGDVIIRNSRFINSGEDGVDVTSGTFILVEGNIIENCYEAAVHVDKTWVNNVEVRGNFMNSNSIKKGLGDLTLRANDCRAVNNIIIGTGHHSVFLESTANTKVWNNVIAPGDRTGNFIWLRADLTNIDIRNNIFDFSRTSQTISGTITSDITFDYNCYFGTSPSQDVFNGATFEEMQSATIEPNGFWADPEFMISSQSEPDHFKLKTTSPCMDNGNTVPVEKDYWGNSRPQGTGIDIGVYESSSLLPIELKNFKADLAVGRVVTLHWTTASEINNELFNIERSYDGNEFFTIGTVRSKGNNSNMELSYEFVDQHPLNGINYYRLKQIDFDGTYTYSSIRTVELDDSLVTNIFPNPFESWIQISGQTTLTSISIFDVTGNLVYQVQPLSTNFVWALPDLKAGLYQLYIQEEHSTEIHKIVKL